MNIHEIKKVLPVLRKHKICPLLWGGQGLGKTQVVKQYAQENNLKFVGLYPATQEPGDIVGLLEKTKDGQASKHLRPEWFPTEGEGIVFIDEINRSHPDLVNAMFSFITNGTIHTHQLPPGWTVVAAANYQTNMFNVTDTSDAAWMSRFCHIDFQPSVEEFVLYLEEKEAFSVASFLRNNPEMSHVKHKERVNTAMITPDHRSWLEMIAKLETETTIDDLRYELYSGIVGPTAAAAFLTDKAKQNERISGKQILSQYQKVRDRVVEASNPKSTRFDMLNSAVEEILLYLPKKDLTKKQMDNFKEFILDVPLEMGLKIINKLHELTWKQKNDILNNPEFVKTFSSKKLSKKEKKK
jgi:hypothetical protein